MTAQELATALLPLLERVSIPMTPGNVQSAGALYKTLDAMARGELRFEQPVKD